MKTGAIRILGDLWPNIRKEALSSSDESVAFLTALNFETSARTIFVAEDLVSAKDNDYLYRSGVHLEVSPLYTSRVLNVAEAKRNTVVMVHSHPFEAGKPRYSDSDDYGERLTSETISNNLPGRPPVGSLLIGQKEIAARMWTGTRKKHFPSTLTVLNGAKYWEYHSSIDGNTDYRRVDRQVLALGRHIQGLIESLHIGIVGLGGTGSIIAEQLARIGIRHLTIIDYDEFEPSNWSRLYGSEWKDVSGRKSKVSIVGGHLKKISGSLDITSIKSSVMRRKSLVTLASCDIIFSCLDRHAPRAVLNELAYQCYVPVIDVGVGLIKDKKDVLGGSVRATVIGPGLPCLFCQEIVRPEIITTEMLAPEEYERRRAEGYASNTQDREPSVITYTSLAGSLGMMLFLDLISGHDIRKNSTVLYDLSTKESLRMRSNIKNECVCKKREGKGLSMPFSVSD